VKHRLLLAIVITALATAWWVRSRFERDLALAVEQAARGSVVAATRCVADRPGPGTDVPARRAGRAAGLRSDTGLGRHLEPCALASIRAPTLVIGARDDGFGTWAGAQDMASRIPQSRFVGFDRGGHLLVGHGDTVLAAIVEHLGRARER
jgi:pimeloyl-ACP methyl ester carboxylesterase